MKTQRISALASPWTQFCVALNSSLADDTKNGDAHHDTKGGGSGSERVDQHRKREKKDRPRIRFVPYAWGADTAEIRRYGPFSLVLCAHVLYSRQGAKAMVLALGRCRLLAVCSRQPMLTDS